ncbi:MAG TPA: hypothetical protein VGC76_08520 [Pyrinomonadaceae bacterium]|jgi:hypothetical protein
MQFEQTENELVIQEAPGCLWMFGLFFAAVGSIFVYGSLGGAADYKSQALWMLALAFVMGATGVCTGIWIIYRAPFTKVVVNRIENEVTITRRGLFLNRMSLYSFDEIDCFCLVEEEDDESSPVWSLGINLSNGETIVISSLASHDERFKRDFVYQTNEFMRKQISSLQMILELEDERDAEMR